MRFMKALAVESIDKAMRLGANHRMGLFELADFIGLDTCLSIMQVLYDGLGDSKGRPARFWSNMSRPVGWGAKPVAALIIAATPVAALSIKQIGNQPCTGAFLISLTGQSSDFVSFHQSPKSSADR